MIPVISTDHELYSQIEQIFKSSELDSITLALKSEKEAIEFLSIEMPELVIIDMEDPVINFEDLLKEIKNDPWLLTSGIIGICQNPYAHQLSSKYTDTNIISFVSHHRIENQLNKVLSIISHNRHILFQRIIGSDLANMISGSYKLQNDPIEAHCFSNLICNFLYALNRIDRATKEKLNYVLNELLQNAIEHGNCEISYKEKSDWLEDENEICSLIEKKCKDPQIAFRNVFIDYTIANEKTSFHIEDQGKGFDWKSQQKKSIKDSMDLHGRGLTITEGITNGLTFNEKGNEVSFSLAHQQGIANDTPALFHNLDSYKFTPGEIVFNEGEMSNFLYYIISGEFEVLINKKPVSVLSPDDIFMGEMSFLLNNRRSATVKARTEGHLIKLSKKEFVKAIKEKPHYSLFLSRLLAQRIERLNKTFSETRK